VRTWGLGFLKSTVVAYATLIATIAFAKQELVDPPLEASSISHRLEIVELWENPELWEIPAFRVASLTLEGPNPRESLLVPEGHLLVDNSALLDDPVLSEGIPPGIVEHPVEPPLEILEVEHADPPPAKQHMIGFELHRDGATWLVGRRGGFGSYSVETVSTLKIGRLEGVFSGYAVHFVGGPARSDLPPRLFELFVGYRAIGDLNPSWSYDVTISPGIYTDFEGHAHQGWRIRGVALAKYRYTPIANMVVGVAYLDRSNLKLLPVGGLVIELGPRTTLELVFPEPRLSMRTHDGESEFYVRGQLGGGSWAIERDSLTNDIATYEDYRLFAGLSSESDDGKSTFFEVGYVFHRSLEYRSGIGDLPLKDTMMFRTGARY
jgi:hypothetical protein